MTHPVLQTKIKVTGLEDISKGFKQVETQFQASASRMRRVGGAVGSGLAKGFSVAGTTIKTTASIGVRSFGLIKTAVGGILTVLKTSISMVISLGKAAVSVGGKLALLGVAAFGAVNAFGIKTGEAIADLGKLARAAGVPVDKFSKLAGATRLVGGSVQDLSTGLQTLSDKIIDAGKDANGGAAASFESIGVSVRDAGGAMKSTEQILNEVANGLKAIPSDTLRSSAALDLFGGAATKLLPILEDGSAGLEEYMQKSDALGTTVDEAQTKRANDLLVKARQVREALIGVSFKVADVLLPELTKNSDKTAAFLAKNAKKIAEIVGKALKEISSLSADFGRAFMGDATRVERAWVRRLVPAFKTVKDTVLDLMVLFAGGEAKRAPWLNDVASVLKETVLSAKALGTEILKASGNGEAKWPTMAEAIRAVLVAFQSLRAGLEGNGDLAEMPWAAKIGETIGNLAVIFGFAAGEVIANREQLAGGLSSFTKTAGDAVKAIVDIWKTGEISKDNPFAWLNQWIVWGQEKFDQAKGLVLRFWEDIKAAYSAIEGVAVLIFDIMTKIAKAIGLDNATQLGIVLLVAKVTGLIGVLQVAMQFVTGFLLSINGTWTLIANNLKLFKATLGKLALYIAGPIAAALGISVFWVLAIGAAIAAVAALLYIFWDDFAAAVDAVGRGIVQVFKWALNGIIAVAKGIGNAFASMWAYVSEGFLLLWDGIVAVWNTVAGFFQDIVDAVSAVFTGLWDGIERRAKAAWLVIEVSWKVMEAFFTAIVEAVLFVFTSLWDYVTSAPGRAWDAMVSVWNGFTGFFKGLVDSVADYFTGLWDGVANGASNAWNKVKSFFGMEDETTLDKAQRMVGEYSPAFASGGILRGPGTGTSDSIWARLSNGEGILNARAVGHYGAGLVHALNGLMVPKTAFADGGIAGQMVPALSPAGMQTLGSLDLSLGGKGIGRVYTDREIVGGLRRGLGRHGAASLGTPARWRK